jgi:hypothetical protein
MRREQKRNAMGGEYECDVRSPVLLPNTSHARAIAQRLAVRKALVVAFKRDGDPKTGEWEEARLIEAYGDIPDEVREMDRI